MLNNTGGSNNTAVGVSAMQSNTTGNQNTAVGKGAMQNNTGGNQNTAVGQNAMLSNTTGTNNTAVGQGTGSNITTGSNNVVIGSGGNASSATVNNEVTLYNGSVNARFQGGTTSWSFTSDARDKTNISGIPVGLNFINTLRPVVYKFDCRNWYENKTPDGSKTDPRFLAGFIAQEVDEAIQLSGHADVLNLVVKNDPENLMLSETNIIPILVKAVQELSERVALLESATAKP
jgi:hypothetical protein